MKLLISLILISTSVFSQVKLTDIDEFRSFSNPEEKSIIESGTDFCNKFFEKNKKIVVSNSRNFKNFFLCKFSNKRNRFYIYMLSHNKKENKTIRETCKETILNWPWISDHMDENFYYQSKEYLKGFYIENLFNNKILNFTKNLKDDLNLINNEINNIIIDNRKSYTLNNKDNNLFVENEIKKLTRVYKRILTREESNLDKIIKSQLNKIVRYKIFINDTKNFTSYSCNWKPGNGIEPYIKKEKFKEFENA